MPRYWREQMTSPAPRGAPGRPAGDAAARPLGDVLTSGGSETYIRPLLTPATNADALDGTNKRHDSFPDDGSQPGTSLSMLQEQLLDPYRVEHACLTYDIGQEAALPDGELALAVCRALNDWTADRWLAEDSRLVGSILTPMHFPDRAATEIRRCAADDRFVSAMLPFNALGQPIGHPIYSPIYEAAAEMGLPIFLHAGMGEFSAPPLRTSQAAFRTTRGLNSLTSSINLSPPTSPASSCTGCSSACQA